MPEIFSVSPGRGRAGDAALTIEGGAFAPSSPFGNSVEFHASPAFPSSQSETTILVAPPGCFGGTYGLCVTDQWVMLSIQRKDTFEWDAVRWWIKADLADLQTGSRLTEKIPTGEDLDNPTVECLTAAAWNRLVTFVEFLAYEVLTAKGALFSRDADGIAQVPVGNNGDELRRVPAGHGTGLLWGPPKRVWTLHWGRNIDSANVRNGGMRTNGAGDDPTDTTKANTHGMPRSGVLRHLTVNVESASGGDTLDQVIVRFNLTTVLYDSGTGLALGVDTSHRVDLDASGTGYRTARDIVVEAYKTGTAGAMELTATLTIEEELRSAVVSTSLEDLIADAVAVTDSVAVVVELGGEASDAVAVTDSAELGMTYAVEVGDQANVTDELAREHTAHRELADTADAQDAAPLGATPEVTS